MQSALCTQKIDLAPSLFDELLASCNLFPAQAGATWKEVGMLLPKEKLMSHSCKRVSLEHWFAGFRCLLLSWPSGGSVLNNDSGEDDYCVSSSARAPFMCVASAVALGSVGVVVAIVVVGRVCSPCTFFVCR